jgi:hypothetical protein
MMVAAAQRRGSGASCLSPCSSSRQLSHTPLGLGEDAQRRKLRHSKAKVAPAHQGEEECTPRSVSPNCSKPSSPSKEGSKEDSSDSSTLLARHSRVGSPQPRELGPAGAAGGRPPLDAIGRQGSVHFAPVRPAEGEAATASATAEEDAALRATRWPWVDKKVCGALHVHVHVHSLEFT